MRRTLGKMTLEEKVAQLVVPGLNGVYTPLDSEAAEKLERLAREGRVGGFHVFGGSEALPPVLLNPVYGTSGGRAIKGDALAIAVLLNRLQRASALAPALHRRLRGRRRLHRRAGRPACPAPWRSAPRGTRASPTRAGRLAAGEGRALGIHVDFYPVVDVNNNPENPIINVRSFGEDPEFVGRMATAYLAGDPGRRHARHGQALPRPRRHGDRHPPRPGRDRAPPRAAGRRGARPVRGRDRRRHRRGHDQPHPASRAGPDGGPARPRSAARS